jgi:hypothetical protein
MQRCTGQVMTKRKGLTGVQNELRLELIQAGGYIRGMK